MYLQTPNECDLCRRYHLRDEDLMNTWSEAYTSSTYGPGVFFDRVHVTRIPDGAAGWQSSDASRISDYWCNERQWYFADGGIVALSSNGFLDRRGSWLYGWGALRFSCRVLGLKPPARRLKGEPFVPDPDLLARAVLETNGVVLDGERTVVPPMYRPDSPARQEYGDLTPRARAFWTRLEVMHREAGVPTRNRGWGPPVSILPSPAVTPMPGP
jgi:hypothetical protein